MLIKSEKKDQSRIYKVYGHIFFVTVDRFINNFDLKEEIKNVTVDLTHAHFWDVSSVMALDKVVIHFRQRGIKVEVQGMNDATATIIDRFGIHDKPEEIEKVIGSY